MVEKRTVPPDPLIDTSEKPGSHYRIPTGGKPFIGVAGKKMPATQLKQVPASLNMSIVTNI